jgi:hypothetical protein
LRRRFELSVECIALPGTDTQLQRISISSLIQNWLLWITQGYKITDTCRYQTCNLLSLGLRPLYATTAWTLGPINWSSFLYFSIEEDFVTWREKFWPAVCELYGVESTGEDINIRQYSLTTHDELLPERVFSGEIARLGSFRTQKP